MKKRLVSPTYRIAQGYLRKENLDPRDYMIVIPELDWIQKFRGMRGEAVEYIVSPIYKTRFQEEFEQIVNACGITVVPVKY